MYILNSSIVIQFAAAETNRIPNILVLFTFNLGDQDHDHDDGFLLTQKLNHKLRVNHLIRPR